MKKKNLKFRIARFIILICFLVTCFILIGESLTPSKKSAEKSNAVGNVIANVVNDINGDQSIIIEPESVNITNKIEEANVFDTMTISVETFPEETRFKSYNYTSSNEDIATVDDQGNVKFLSPGTVELLAINDYDSNIKDSFIVNVNKIKVESFDITIPNSIFEDDTYILYIGKSYNIITNVTPSNSTITDVKYDIEENEYISLGDSQINVLKESVDSIIEIKITVDEISKSIYIKTKEVPIINVPLESFTASPITGYEKQTISISKYLSFSPSNATNKQYVIDEIENSDIATKKNNSTINLISPGVTNIRLKSIDGNIVVTTTITVKERPELTNYVAKVSGSNIFIGENKKIILSNPTPSLALIQNPTYESLTPSIVSVNSSGYVNGINVGSGMVKVTVSGIEKIINIEVLNNEENTTDIVIDYKMGENPDILVLEEINLKNYFSVSEFIPNEPINDTISYELVEGNASLNGNLLKPFDEGLIKIMVLHNSSDVYKIVSLYAYYRINIEKDFTDTKLILNKEYKINISSNSIYGIDVISNNDNCNIIYDINCIRIIPSSIGLLDISIYPKKEDGIIDKPININYEIIHLDTASMNVNLKITNINNEVNEIDNPDLLNIYLNDKIEYNIVLDKGITRKNIKILSSNPDVIRIVNQQIKLVGIGNTKLEFLESYSNITHTININVYNKVILNEKNSIIFKGNYKYDNETNTLSITNGNSLSIKYNFSKGTTYKETKYSVLDESICIIGSDGVITPIKPGETKIILKVEDENGTIIENEFNIIILKKDIIENLHSFIYQVRKALGHFGVFLVLAIFAALSIFMYFDKRKWYIVLIKIILLFSFGFGFAAFTEFLQTLVPGRYGALSDILIDFSGYLVSAVSITIGFIIFLIIKHIKKRKINNNEGV